ncbi:MAG: response regulator [Ghiorsea sp.]
MNPVLARQLRRLKLDASSPPDAETWAKLLTRLDSVFDHNDQTLSRLDRSLKLSSEEMQGIYETLREHEVEIQAKHNQLDTVLDAVQAGVCAVSPEGELLFINDGGRSLLGLEDTALPHASALLPQFQAGNEPFSVESMFAVLEQTPAKFFEHCTLTHCGNSIPVSIHLSTLDKHDIKSFVVMVFQDITDQLKTEADKQHTQKMSTIGNLIAGISHELNNMLTTITGNLFLAKVKLPAEDHILPRLITAERLAFDMGDVIAHLMAFSGQSIVSREMIALNEVIAQETAEFKTQISDKVMLGIYIHEGDVLTFGSSEQIRQLLNHLLNNAKDAVISTPLPNIHVCLEYFIADQAFCAQHHVSLHHYAKLSVHDNGCGIEESQLSRIFDPFYTGKSFGKGKGLGLSMVQGAVQMHHGLIEVESQINVGTTFDIYFPLEEQHQDSAHPHSNKKTLPLPPQDPTDHKQHILLAEDNLIVQEIAKELLLKLGYHVITANDGVEAVKAYKARGQDIGLVLMDIMMPNMNGTTACLKIREIDPHAKVIFVSGYDQNNAQLAELGLENALFLSKPYNITQLAAMVACELEIH